MLACSGSVDVAPQQIETPPHVVRVCRTRSQTSGIRAWLGFGGNVLGFFRCLGSSGSFRFGDALGQECNQQVVSTPLACQHATVTTMSQRTLARGCHEPVHTATNTHQAKTCFRIFASEHDASLLCGESSGWPLVSAFVPPPTWSYDEQSTHSSYHVRCGFGWERLNRCERRRRSNGENGGVTRLRQRSTGREHGHTEWPAELANVA